MNWERKDQWREEIYAIMAGTENEDKKNDTVVCKYGSLREDIFKQNGWI